VKKAKNILTQKRGNTKNGEYCKRQAMLCAISSSVIKTKGQKKLN
jgi:hypothetical protein